jgi:hypothetical protein
MNFADWFESDGRDAVQSSGLADSGATIRSICQRAFDAGERLAHRQESDAAMRLDRWVAHYYLFGLIPVGSLEIDRGRARGDAWLDARINLRRLLRPFIGIDIRT